ncbi:MAG: hypothetical protein R3F15_16365 [Lysobacterales bacterium]
MTSEMRFEARTWWLNRLIADLIPLTMLVIGIFFRNPDDTASAVIYFGTVGALIILFEVTSLNYTITIDGDTLRYWSLPRFCSRPQKFNLKEISSADCAKYNGMKTASVVVKFSDQSRKPAVMHLASFKPTDIGYILRWLEKGREPRKE